MDGFFNLEKMESKNLLEALERMLALKNQTASIPSVPSEPIVPGPSTSVPNSVAPVPCRSILKRILATNQAVPANGHSATVSYRSILKRHLATNQEVPSKKPRLERTVRSSIGNTFSSIEIPVDNDTDLLEFLARVKDEIEGLIVAQLGERGALKFYLTVKTQLSRTSTDGLEQITTPYFCSIPVIVLQSTDIGDEIDIAGHRIKELLATHESQGSGFKLDSISDCQLHVATYDKIGGSSYLPLPKFVQIKRATINIKNNDLNCLQYSVLYTKLQPANHPDRVHHYTKHLDELNMTGIRTPVEITQLRKFEQQNPDFSMNVYALNDRKR